MFIFRVIWGILGRDVYLVENIRIKQKPNCSYCKGRLIIIKYSDINVFPRLILLYHAVTFSEEVF